MFWNKDICRYTSFLSFKPRFHFCQTKSDLSKQVDLTDRAEAETQISENAADSPSQDNYDQYDPGPLSDKSDLQEAEEADDYYDDDDDASDVINDDDDVEDLFDDDVEGIGNFVMVYRMFSFLYNVVYKSRNVHFISVIIKSKENCLHC